MSMNETFREEGRLAAIQSMITSNKNILLSFNLIENALRLMVAFFYPRVHVHLESIRWTKGTPCSKLYGKYLK